MEALRPVSRVEGPEREGKGVVVVGPAAARWAGARMRRRACQRKSTMNEWMGVNMTGNELTLIIQLETWLMLRPVA